MTIRNGFKEADPVSNDEEADKDMIVEHLLLCQGICIQERKSRTPNDLQTHWSNQVTANTASIIATIVLVNGEYYSEEGSMLTILCQNHFHLKTSPNKQN